VTAKQTTHVLMVVDRSGSMAGLMDEVRGGFNSFLDQLAKDEADDGVERRVTAVLFDDRYELLAVAAPVAEVPRLDEENCSARGMTALLDAIGRTITRFEASMTLRRKDRVLLVVQTDGAENASQEFQQGQIMQMLRQREGTEAKPGKWTTVYLGAGPQAWGQGRSLGFSTNVNTTGDRGSYTTSYETVAVAAAGVSRGESRSATRSTFAAAGVLDDDSGGGDAA
jgi:hypothetical protein